MLIIISMYVIMYILLKNNIKNNKKIKKTIFYGLIIEIFLFIIYRLNLYFLGREVYYSDAATYWQKTLELIKYGKTSGYNSLYYEMCFLIQKTSPFVWCGWNNIFNITCINMSLLIVIQNMIKKHTKIDNIKWLIISIMYNPFIIYGLMRNLKDAFFMLMVFIVIYLYSKLYETKSLLIKLLILIGIVFFSYLFTIIRPWGFIISICAIVLYLFQILKSKIKNVKFEIDKRKFVYLIVGCLIIIFTSVFVYPVISVNIKIWYPIVKNSFFTKNIITIMLGIMKFILAPGPVRSILGTKYFEHYTITGNIMCFIGSIMWWMSIIVMATNVFLQRKKIKIDHFNLLLLFIIIIYILIYTIQYGGIAEIRLRSALYVFVYSIFYNVFDLYKIKNNKRIYKIFLISCLLIFLITIIIGIK